MTAAIVPIKLRSRRLPNKNFLLLGEKPLAHYIFETLLRTPEIDNVYCYTSQAAIMKILPPQVKLLPRPNRLDGNEIQANELFQYAVENINAEIVIIGQVPGPFITQQSLSKGIKAVSSGEFDSAIAVKRIQTYCWANNMPINYDPSNMLQTQNLQPIFAETSGFYVFKKDDYLKSGSRINGRVCLIEVTERESLDIDDPKDFSLAQNLLNYEEADFKNFAQDPFLLKLTNEINGQNHIRHISFDLDGVIIDSIGLMHDAWKHVSNLHGLQIPFEKYREQIGRPMSDILKIINVPHELVTPVIRDYEKFSSKNKSIVKLNEGIMDLVNFLKNKKIKVSVVTSKSRERSNAILEGLGILDFIDCVVSPEDINSGRGKPNPDPLLTACILVGADPGDSVYIGDMEIDRIASARAGMHFIHAGWGYGEISNNSEIWFDHVENLKDFLVDALS